MGIQWDIWKKPIILLISTGLAGMGNFIYLVAINLLVYQMTGSAAHVAGLWIIGPTINVLTKFWTGSFIDYRSKRKIMMVTYVTRAILIFLIPFLPNIYSVYLVLILLSVANSFFVPSSVTYTTKLVPIEIRKRYNSIHSLTTSGAFIVGPAIAGTLILLRGIDFTFAMNGLLFVGSALLLFFLPETDQENPASAPRLTFSQIRSDWFVVLEFFKKQKYVAFIYSMYLTTTIFSFAMDAQEVVFAQRVVGLSELEYSLLISITGIGAIVGAFLVTMFAQKLSLRVMISLGMLMETVGYLCYAFSWSFLSITIGFTVLGLFNAFINAGITTFYQNNVPTDIMGRVTSVFQLFQSLLQIIFVLLVGTIADIIPLRITIICLSTGMLVVALITVVNIVRKSKMGFFLESHSQETQSVQ